MVAPNKAGARRLHPMRSWFTQMKLNLTVHAVLELHMSPNILRFKSNKSQQGRFLTQAIALAALTAVAGCSSVGETLQPRQTIHQGYVVDQEALALVPVGSSREQVLLALGSPSTTATFDTEALYYISQTRVRGAAFMKPKLVSQRVLAVYLGVDGRVTQIADYGLQDGKVFDFISRTTPTGGADASFVQGIISSLSSSSSAQQSARGLLGN